MKCPLCGVKRVLSRQCRFGLVHERRPGNHFAPPDLSDGKGPLIPSRAGETAPTPVPWGFGGPLSRCHWGLIF